MPKNPFKEEDPNVEEPAGKGGEGRRDADAEGSGKDDAESDEESAAAKHPLFDDKGGSADAPNDLFTDEDEVAVTEVEGEGDDAKMKVSTFKKRIGKVIKQREDAKRKSQEAEVAAAAASAERNTIRETLAEFRKKYAEEPELALWDSRFMDALDTLSKQSPDIARLAHTVKEFMGGKDIGGTMTTNEPTAKNIEPNVSSTKLNAVLERDARRTVADVLPGVKPAFVKILSDHVVSESGKLEDLTADDALEMCRKYIKDAGLTAQEILDGVKPDAGEGEEDPSKKGKKGGKPTTGGRLKAGTTTSKDGDDEEPRDAPKSIDEWEANRKKRLNSFLAGIDI
jgi:hypothetical protein